jgi:quercetin dioxygenase-like cupin family protein
MAKVRVREGEREVESKNTYEISMYMRKKFIELQMMGQVVIHENDREWEQSRQGRIKWYCSPALQGANYPLREWRIFKHDIRKHSGSHKHQGGFIIFCLEGKGYSVIEGVRHDWEGGDLLLLPLKTGGIEHQHFNLEPGKPCKWIAFNYNPHLDLLASETIQLEISPDYL